MSDPVRRDRMTADQFIAWAIEQPQTEHFELVAGEVVAMAPERVGHVRAKQRIYTLLSRGAERLGGHCEVLMDGAVVVVDEATVYEPDAMLRCGPALPDDAVKITDPMIVVEVISRSLRALDSGLKFTDYFRIPSLRHYLVVRPEVRVLIHHARGADGSITSRVLSTGPLVLDPPGIELASLFD